MAEKAIDPRILESRRYWAEREEENRRNTIKDEEKRAAEIRRVLLAAAESIRKEIEAFYGRYAEKEGITLADAKKRVSALDIKAYAEKAKKYVAEKDFTKQANDEMRIYNLTMKVNRLEMLKSDIGLELCAAYSDLENYFGESLTETARKEFTRQAGILGKTGPNMERVRMEKHVREIVDGSFKGAHFSERLWTDHAYLKLQLDDLLRTGLIQGRNPRELAKGLRKHIETSVYNSERLMRTEMCRVQIGAQLASYKASGFDKLIIIPEHDSRSCDYCESQDGVIVEVAKAEPGVNVPPFHPMCRCATSSWVGEESEIRKRDEEQMGNKDENGLVPLSRVYVNKNDGLYSRMKKVKPYKDYEDFGVHGVPSQSKIMYETTNGTETLYSAKEYAEILRSDPSYKGGKVRLLSCGAGSDISSFASELAKELGQEVLAPTETLWVGEEGQLFISDSDVLAEMWYNNGKIDNEIHQTGQWKQFFP